MRRKELMISLALTGIMFMTSACTIPGYTNNQSIFSDEPQVNVVEAADPDSTTDTEENDKSDKEEPRKEEIAENEDSLEEELDYVENEQDVYVTINFDGEYNIFCGEYTGEKKDGKPHGNGVFTVTEGSYNIIYDGEFLNGMPDGYGKLIFKGGGQYATISGYFEAGNYVPTYAQVISDIAQVGNAGSFEISEEVMDYFDKYEDAFLNGKKSDDMDVLNFSYDDFYKNEKQDEVGLVKIELNALHIYEDKWLNESNITTVFATDDKQNMYTIYYLGLSDVAIGDDFIAYAVPVADSSFVAQNGKNINTVNFIACELKKK